MRIIKNTPVKEAIREARNNGALIAGTSAGASVMSKRMITGNALMDTVLSPTFKRLSKGNLELKEGLGLLDSVIIDQHFVVRSRYNRMLSAIMEYHINSTCMVHYIQPVAGILPIAIYRQWLAVANVIDKQWYQFFREVIWPVVVRAVGYQDGQSVRPLPGLGEMIGRGL